MQSEVASRVDFSSIRYAQCWEDADILLRGLDIRPGHTCLSIASAGDNTLAMLSRAPERVIALDLSPAQIACLELRVAAFRELSHNEMLELVGSSPSSRRELLYCRCRMQLSSDARRFWDFRSDEIVRGFGGAGKLEWYFALFRTLVLPLIHSKKQVRQLLRGGTPEQRHRFYREEWDTWRWQLAAWMFFSRFVISRFGRDPELFHYVEESFSEHILERSQYAVTALNPADNPYLQWILAGRHLTALPFALRPENFEAIRDHLDCLEWHCKPIEDFLDRTDKDFIDRFNLSDIFEYMSPDNYCRLLERLVRAGRRGGRLAYWNMLAERQRPKELADRLRPLTRLGRQLHMEDKAFFYKTFILEEIM